MAIEKVQDIVKACIEEYGHYALENRAIPHIYDGLKPSIRRILWAMYTLKAFPNRPSIKSGRIVGETMGKYHPHGDSSIYGALVLLAHDKDPLIIPDGNFGDIKSYIKKPAASSRYTECRLSELALRLFDDIEVADFIPNYDETLTEPSVLPTRVPLLLVKGAEGIAVGLSTNIPPHNLGEIIDACCYVIDNPEATVSDLMEIVKGPDYGVGQIISSKEELMNLYATGKGQITFSSDFYIEKGKPNTLVITGFSPELRGRRQKLLNESIACFEENLIDSPLTDETTLESGYRFTIKFTDIAPIKERILPLLESQVSYQWYCLDKNKKPKLFNLKEAIEAFLDFRREIESRALKRQIKKIKQKIAITKARYIAATNSDTIVNILKTSKTNTIAVKTIIKKFNLSEKQANYIVQTKFGILIKENTDKIKRNLKSLKNEYIETKNNLLNIDNIVKQHLLELKKYSFPRGTKSKHKDVDLDKFSNKNTSKVFWIGAEKDNKITYGVWPPTKAKSKWAYKVFEQAKDYVCVVYDTNLGVSSHIATIRKHTKQPGNIIGISTKTYCLVVSDNKYVLFPSRQKRNVFNIFSKDIYPKFAIGINEQDKIVIKNDKGRLKIFDLNMLKITRPNVQGYSAGIKNFTFVGALLPGAIMVSSKSGRQIAETNNSTKNDIFIVANSNFVIYDNKRVIADMKTTIDIIKSSKVEFVYAIN